MIGDMHYKDYVGSIEYSEKDNILYGKVLGIKSLILYEGKSVDELRSDFISSIEAYINDCEKNNIIPERSFKGSFNVRINPNLHMELATYALNNNKSLNKVVEDALLSFVKTINN